MHYDTFVKHVADLAETTKKAVREILNQLPEVLITMEEDEVVRTPLGSFKMQHRRSKRVCLPSKVWAASPERFQVRLQPGHRLEREYLPNEDDLVSTPGPVAAMSAPVGGDQCQPV